jgi:hypothetical protein
MVWIAFLITAFLVIGLRERTRPGRKHLLALIVTGLTLGAVFLTFGSG